MHQDDNTIDFDISDVADGSVIVTQGGYAHIPTNISNGSAGGGNQNGYGNITYSGTINGVGTASLPIFNIPIPAAPPPTKTNVKYIVALVSGDTWELEEQAMMTPREMLGICKFINVINAYVLVGSATNSPNAFNPMWSDLILNLGIRRHFVPGKKMDDYDTGGDTLHIFLHDVP